MSAFKAMLLPFPSLGGCWVNFGKNRLSKELYCLENCVNWCNHSWTYEFILEGRVHFRIHLGNLRLQNAWNKANQAKITPVNDADHFCRYWCLCSDVAFAHSIMWFRRGFLICSGPAEIIRCPGWNCSDTQDYNMAIDLWIYSDFYAKFFESSTVVSTSSFCHAIRLTCL